VLPVVLATLAAALVIGALLLSGTSSEGGSSRSSGDSKRSTSSTPERRGTASTTTPTAAAPAPAPAPTQTQATPAPGQQPSAGGIDPERGRQLNDQGFALSNQGRNEEAVPILQQAVASFPEDSEDINYAYALYNLGHALRLSGRPDEAVPPLQRRLKVSDYKRGVVQRELSLARAEAKGG
jgi:tetratricopeptide (TPR) repeat protein